MPWKTRTWPILALAAAAALGAAGARAASFDVVRSGPDMVILIDPSAVETVAGEGKVRRARTVTVQRSITADGPKQPGYVSTINDYDCLKWRSRWRTFSVYSRFGGLVLHKDNDDPDWAPIEGNFEAQAAARIVCDGRGSDSVYTASSIGQLVTTLIQAWDAAEPLPPLQPVAPLPAAKKKPAPSRP